MTESRPKKFIKIYYPEIIAILSISVILFLTHYWNIGKYGLYEDDLTFIPNALKMDFSQLIKFILNYIANLYGHGRPLSDSFIHLFSHTGWRIGGILGIYWIGYAIELINALLIYALIRRLHPSRSMAFLAGMVFVLYPADTTKIFLTHSLGLQPSILLILLAFHSYLSHRWLLAYSLAAIVTFAYETPFTVFIAAPLLTFEWDRKLIKRFLFHGLALAIMLGLTYVLRTIIGEARVANLSWVEMITVPLSHMVIGPVVAMGTFVYRPIQVLGSLNLPTIILTMTSILLFGSSLWFFLKHDPGTKPSGVKNPASERFNQLIGWVTLHPSEVRILLAGLVMLVAAYALTFTTRAYAITGRDTRVHAAAAVGASIVVAGIIYLLLHNLRTTVKAVVFGGVVLLLAFLVAFGYSVQLEYVRAWELQQEFWTELLPLIQDVEPGSVVLIDPQGMEDTHQIWANHWNLPRILVQFYQFPDGWRPLPRVYRLVPDWQDSIVGEDGLFRIDEATVVAPTSTYQEVNSSNVILILHAGSRLTRQSEPLTIQGQPFPLKTLAQPTISELEQDLLYDLFFNLK